jgi:hypothetical protein
MLEKERNNASAVSRDQLEKKKEKGLAAGG